MIDLFIYWDPPVFPPWSWSWFCEGRYKYLPYFPWLRVFDM